ncbi:MAG: RNA-binding protein [Bacteroidota bacterium]
MNIYVGNLHFNVDSEDLKRVFEEYGEVTSATVITDKFTGRSKGFGFVEMSENDDANKAIEALNQAELQGRAMKVNEARERTEDNNRKRY